MFLLGHSRLLYRMNHTEPRETGRRPGKTRWAWTRVRMDVGRRGLELCFGDRSSRTVVDLDLVVDRGGDITLLLHSANYAL